MSSLHSVDSVDYLADFPASRRTRMDVLSVSLALPAVTTPIALSSSRPKPRWVPALHRLHVAHQIHVAHHFHINLGDLPTWLLFVGAVMAAGIALRQLRTQQEDSARGVRLLERQQADMVDFAWCQAGSVQFIPTASVPGFAGKRTAVVVVSNDSGRPIRIVTSRIRLEDGTDLEPDALGVVEKMERGLLKTYTMHDPHPGTQVALIRPGFSYGFIFKFSIPDDDAAHPELRTAQPFTRFTDDADLSWEIDGDLRLMPAPPPRRRRNWWWRQVAEVRARRSAGGPT